jgi:cutinase
MHGSIRNLPSTVKSRIEGVVLFGDPRNVADNGQIPNYPRSQTKIFCFPLDVICQGILEVTYWHLQYGQDIPAAISFIKDMLAPSNPLLDLFGLLVGGHRH